MAPPCVKGLRYNPCPCSCRRRSMKAARASIGILRLRPILTDSIWPVAVSRRTVDSAKDNLRAASETVSSRTLFSIVLQPGLVADGQARDFPQREITYGVA